MMTLNDSTGKHEGENTLCRRHPKKGPASTNQGTLVSMDVAGSETLNDTVEDYCTAKFSISSASCSSTSDRMVASTHSLDDLTINHSANTSNSDRQQHQQQLQEKYGHYRSAQTAQDKRSRLSNVINNLRKKVPDGSKSTDSPGKEEDDRNSVERNLETLEKYVMTVLNGVIKDNEDDEKDVAEKGKSVEKTKESERKRKTDENSTLMTVKFEASRSNEGDIEAAVVPQMDDSSMIELCDTENVESSGRIDYSDAKSATEENVEDSEVRPSQTLKDSRRTEEERLDAKEEESSTSNAAEDNRDILKEKKENRTLSTIILDRLSDHQVEERANVDDGRGDRQSEHILENADLRAICRELLNDLINSIHRTIDEENRKTEECAKLDDINTAESKIEETKDLNATQELPMTSLHCSLPLDKVASVLQNCHTGEFGELVASRISSRSSNLQLTNSTQDSIQKSSMKPSSCTIPIRHLCLYCDRKFLSISLRQRHTERVHQLGGGRRSERNSRKPSHNCQYCSEKCADTLEGLFQHMVNCHADKYHACIQCSTRYLTREALVGHMGEMHSANAEKSQIQLEKIKEGSPCKEFCIQSLRERNNVVTVKERKSEEKEVESLGDRLDNASAKLITARDPISNPASPEFDSSFYSNVSCNIRENLLHHLDGKLQTPSSSSSMCTSSVTSTITTESKPQQAQSQQQLQQTYYEHSVNQIQLPIEISLTAATPMYNKGYSTEEYENSSEYARKPSKTSSSRPRRVSFEKYNFPRKYDGREQSSCSIKDLSKFDISTQLSLRKKQQLIKERITISKLHQISVLSPSEATEMSHQEQSQSIGKIVTDKQDSTTNDCEANASSILDIIHCDLGKPPPGEPKTEITIEPSSTLPPSVTPSTIPQFSTEFEDFMRLRKKEQSINDAAKTQAIAYAELTGEWSRPRVYICGACTSKHVMLKEMEDHKASMHPNVWCSHFEFSGDQRELYKHLFLPGRNVPTAQAKNAVLMEKVCTKCTKNCHSLAELHRHMLECGGDQTWLQGLFGNGKKKCKWRPFGSRSRKRRQRGMKRSIQNSQTPRVNTPKEKQPAGPRVRPSDRESIQKMLANLPAKRATRKVLQDSAMRSQGRLRNVQTRSRPRIIGDGSSISRISRNKAALRNKLLKNAKSIQRNRCRSDNISAVIESVVNNCYEKDKRSDDGSNENSESVNNNNGNEINESLSKTSRISNSDDKAARSKTVGRPKVLCKKRNVKTKIIGLIGKSRLQVKDGNSLANFKIKGKLMKLKSGVLETKLHMNCDEVSFSKNTPKNVKTTLKMIDKEDINSDGKTKTSTILSKNKHLTHTALKRKRPIDPVVSLNASIKAKSQLRTQDGKFARNPNKMMDVSLKSSETKVDDGKHKNTESLEIKPKLRAMQKSKKFETHPPRRVTRLSSDSDKMPTLEPVVQISSTEDYTDKSTNDLPILSPVTSSTSLQERRILQIPAKCNSRTKESDMEIDMNTDILEKSIKEQKQIRGRKSKEEVKDSKKRKIIDTSEDNEASISKNNSKVFKEGKVNNRKRLLVTNTNGDEDNKGDTLKSETIDKKDSKMKKEEATRETRSNSKSRIEKDSVKLSDIPFEVKKLLGSVNKEDLLNTLELASNDSSLKRSLRQSLPKSRVLQVNDKNLKELDYECNSSKVSIKKEKNETVRKSPRYAKKKKDEKVRTSLEKDVSNNTTSEMVDIERSHKDSRSGIKAKESTNDNVVIEDRNDNRQTKGSLVDTKNEISSEIGGDNSRKRNVLPGKRRGRPKSMDLSAQETSTYVIEEHSCGKKNGILTKNDLKKGIEDTVDKINKNETKSENNSVSKDRLDSALMNLNLSHLQTETANSIDSGKENSVETSMNIYKLKTARPKKTWGTRRERASRKRSLSNVIGILTEGINIPVEVQQNVVLTVQTSLDNPDRVVRNGAQQPIGEGNVVAVDSYSELLVRSDESSENDVITANTNTNNRTDNERNNRPCPGKAENENAFTNQKVLDVSSKVVSAKACSPANDIILDLSRRKPKGKGSFLEKIVSKIAKQKDALLEGEVGSLLDTAADELTNILNEVGPTLVDNAENANPDETKENPSKNNSKDMSNGKTSLQMITSPLQLLEDKKSDKDNSIFKSSIETLESQHNTEVNLIGKTEVQNEKQINANDVLDTKIKDIVDKKVANTDSSVATTEFESCENELIINETSSEVYSSSDTSQKTNLEYVDKKKNGTKSKRKSSKRLEVANSSKKDKKSSEDNEKYMEENKTHKELQFDDVTAFTNKQEDTSNIKNKISEKGDETLETSSKVSEKTYNKLQCDTINNEVENSESKEDFTKNREDLNSEKFASSATNVCKSAIKPVTNLSDSISKIMSDEKESIDNVQAMELNEKCAISSIPSSKKNVKSGKSRDRNQKSEQTDLNHSELPSKRTSKRNSETTLSPIHTTTNVHQTSIKPIDVVDNISYLSPNAKEQFLESTVEQLINIDTNNDTDAVISVEKFSAVAQTVSKKNENPHDRNDQNNFINIVPPKKTRNRSGRKKSLADEHLDLSEDESIKVDLKLNDDSSMVTFNEQLSATTEHFKVPEVTDLLQSGKKRDLKRKSLTEETHWNDVSEDSQENEESLQTNEKSILTEKSEEQKETENHIIEKSHVKKLERSSFLESIGLISFAKMRSASRKKQLSSEDLSDIRIQNTESADDVSDNSCASEFSYFRRKRLVKKRKKGIETSNNVQTHSSIIDLKSLGNDKQSQKKKLSESTSLLDEHLDLSEMDEIIVPMDIQASLKNAKILDNIEKEFEFTEKSNSQNECVSEAISNDRPNNDSYFTSESSAMNNYECSDELITPKKRTAGNFVVVHTKTGEILIVEKKKKLTKEAARFFCDVCATSFTRKSSLKKHTLSQSHLSQVTKSTKDKIELDNNVSETTEDINNDWKNQSNDGDTETFSENTHLEIAQNSLELNESYIHYTTSMESTRQEALEDELLDEEICKITENMSHDEYVLTDHVSPDQPESSSTPIKPIQEKGKDFTQDDKKRNKLKKRNLAEEHLALDTPELDKFRTDSNEFLNSVNDQSIRLSSQSCNYNSAKNTSQTEESEICQKTQCIDVTETTDNVQLIVKSSQINSSKLSVDDINMKIQEPLEPIRTTRSTLKKLSKAEREEGENQISSLDDDKPSNRFSLRPRRNKKLIHQFEEFDIETDIEFMDTAMEINYDEIDENLRKKQIETEKEISKNVRQMMESSFVEYANVENKHSENIESKKTGRKRGRPRLKNRNVLNSGIDLINTKSEFNESNVSAASNFEKSKVNDQKSNSHTEAIEKSQYPDAYIQPTKPRRGRPRKNAQVVNNSSKPANNCDVSESTRSNHNNIQKNTQEIKLQSKTITEEITTTRLINSQDSSVESSSTLKDFTRESNLSEMQVNLLNVEEKNDACFASGINTSEDQSMQKVELMPINTIDNIVVKDCDVSICNVSTKEDNSNDSSILLKIKTNMDDAKCTSEIESNRNNISDSVLTNPVDEFSTELFRISEKVQKELLQAPTTIDVLASMGSKTIRFDNDENFEEVQKLSEISKLSKKKQTKPEDESLRKEVYTLIEEKAKLPSDSEDSEDEILTIDDKSFSVINSHESLSPKMTDDITYNEKTIRLDICNKKPSKSSQSTSKDRGTDRRRTKATRNRNKKISVTKITELSSDSEIEDRVESASSSKSKIVKSVFGRVFGGEKADRVKEVLNDWVSRSEDESDVSRSGSAKIAENGHKKDKKRRSKSDSKKNTERSPKKKENDKSSNEIYRKSKNRKKRDETEIMPNDNIEPFINPVKQRRRESKIKADERILRTFDDESLIFSDEDTDIEEEYELKDQFDGNRGKKKSAESSSCQEEYRIEQQVKDRNSSSDTWENLHTDHDTFGKLKTSSDRKKRDAKNERSSPSQFNMFKYKCRESKTRAGERIWQSFDNETLPCFSNDQDLNKLHNIKEQGMFYESGNTDDLSNLKSIKQEDNDTWKNLASENQDQSGTNSEHRRLRKASSSCKRQDSNAISNELSSSTNASTNKHKMISSKSAEIQNDQVMRYSNETKNKKNLALVKAHEPFIYNSLDTLKPISQEHDNLLIELNDSQTFSNSKKSKKSNSSTDWKHSTKKLEFDQEHQSGEQEIVRKDEESTMSSRSCSSLVVEMQITKDQLVEIDEDSQIIQESNDSDDEEDDEDKEDDLSKRRISPFYARRTPDSSMENSSNNDEDEEGEEEEEKHIILEDNSKKINPNEFSGEKIVIRSPLSGHRSDVVTITPTDAIEDNALDVPREIESTTELRQGKILNFDEELFVECCSRLKATTENELRGAKKIKLDHTESYHKRDDQSQGFRTNRDRWRDVESQNSLGSLLESVNQLLGEEMYSSRERSYRTRGSEHSSRSASPDVSRTDNLGYEDSLDVAFEHNNKLRDKIQQRMRESENLIASTFGQKTNETNQNYPDDDKTDNIGNSYSSSMVKHEHLSSSIANREQDSSGLKNKMNSTLGGLLDKALSNLLHNNGKHDHNGSAPMKLLAELACARAPTSTSPKGTTSERNHQSVKIVAAAVAAAAAAAAAVAKDSIPDSPKRLVKDSALISKNSQTKKGRNPIKELFERKKEINDRKEQERSKATTIELNMQKQRKLKKGKKQQQQEFPLIRRNEQYGGLVEKKKRRDIFERKGDSLSERIKDVYDFDDEESQIAPALGSVMSYRNQVDKNYDTNWLKAKNADKDDVTAETSKTSYTADTKLNSMIDRKFRELEKFAPKTKGALKSFQSEEHQQRISGLITGPMDEFVERKQRTKRPAEYNLKHAKLKKRGKSSKKKTRNAWYENDSSDEFRTAAKAEDVGVGISKSQRACSKGKQNLFAELSTSSDSEFERNDADYEIMSEQHTSKTTKNLKESFDVNGPHSDQVMVINETGFESEDKVRKDWCDQIIQEDIIKKDLDTGKSESDMSDHSLVIDERKITDEARNSDDDADNHYERVFELDDLYREDSSDAETENEDNETLMTEDAKNIEEEALNQNVTLQAETVFTKMKKDCMSENELIPLEEALDLLDQHEDLNQKSENTVTEKYRLENMKLVNKIVKAADEISDSRIITGETEDKCANSTKLQDEKEELDDNLPTLPEKLSSNEKPQKESENLPLHVFLSRKVQESKKRKQQQLNKLREEQERILMDFQPTRRQRKCAIGKQGLLAEISSSDDEPCTRDINKRGNEKSDHDKSRKKRELKEKRKERYIEKKHEQMIAKEQKAIEEEILREVGKRKEILAYNADETELNIDIAMEGKGVSGQTQKKKQLKEKQKKVIDENATENLEHAIQSFDNFEEGHNKSEHNFPIIEDSSDNSHMLPKRKKHSKSPVRSKKISKSENVKSITNRKSKESTTEKSKNRTTSTSNKETKDRKSFSGKRDSDDEELKTTKSWNKVEEGVGVAIGRRKRTAALQLYYWSSSSDEEEIPEFVPAPEEEEDDRQEQHGWIVGDSHKRMITMLAMEKQLKEKRRRSEDEFEPGKTKNKKHRNSTS